MNIRKGLIAGVVAVGVLTGNAHAAAPYSGIVVIGDSLSDAGNFGAFFGPGTIPAPYFADHFSNGKTWIEDVASSLGLQLKPSAAGGSDFAWGGATTGAPLAQNGLLPPFDLQVQTQQFLTGAGGVAHPELLYVVWGGGNDLLQGNVTGTIANLATTITTLAGAGARHFLISNGYDTTPKANALGAQTVALTKFVVGQLNDALDQSLHGLANQMPLLDIREMNTAGLFHSLVANPAGFGLSNVTDACFVASVPSLCADPAAFLFWDSVHPTAHGHQLIADEALRTLNAAPIPVPPALWLFGSALGLLGIERRRRAA